jgi:hypothetical protein
MHVFSHYRQRMQSLLPLSHQVPEPYKRSFSTPPTTTTPTTSAFSFFVRGAFLGEFGIAASPVPWPREVRLTPRCADGSSKWHLVLVLEGRQVEPHVRDCPITSIRKLLPRSPAKAQSRIHTILAMSHNHTRVLIQSAASTESLGQRQPNLS